MIRTVTIENYKTMSEFTLELGRVNLFIGANGCGKSNILEAITFGSAAAASKLDNEFLANRGIRVTDPRLMRCGFDKANLDKPIRAAFTADEGADYDILLVNPDKHYPGWIGIPADDSEVVVLEMMLSDLTAAGFTPKSAVRLLEELRRVLKENGTDVEFPDSWSPDDIRRTLQRIPSPVRLELRSFLAYAPQISTLRNLQLDSAIQPLGIHGEGLFRLLQVLEADGKLAEVNEAIGAIDWFDGLELVGNGGLGGRRIRIVDRFLDPEVSGLDHLSANEGFLFFLFYVALLVSPHTPRFFAVENVDESLNPKLCVHLLHTIVRLAERHDKQVILTTHNPAALDGLDLRDDEQRLFVIYRNADGHTRARRVSAPSDGDQAQSVRLSEAFIRGYLGGLPTGF